MKIKEITLSATIPSQQYKYPVSRISGILGHKEVKHGKYGTPIYRTWQRMGQRCNNPNNRHYSGYGGRGITVCDRWGRFENFYEDMGDKPTPKHSLERIDNNKGYSPDNCKWATMAEQGSNRRDNRKYTYDGKTMTIAEWARELNISHAALTKRLNRWSVGRALSEPLHKEFIR